MPGCGDPPRLISRCARPLGGAVRPRRARRALELDRIRGARQTDRRRDACAQVDAAAAGLEPADHPAGAAQGREQLVRRAVRSPQGHGAMTDVVNRGALRVLLADSYNELKRVLARRLGSTDAASDVLHETYLRLERFDELVPVANPRAYLLRMALNVAYDYQRTESRLVTAVELDELWRLGDDSADPETVTAARADLALFRAALSELPPRSQAILLAARVEEVSHEVIAERFGISTRMVQFELRRALRHCAKRLKRKIVRRFGPAPADQS